MNDDQAMDSSSKQHKEQAEQSGPVALAIVTVPGSPNAVRLAWEKLIAPELAHLAWEVVR